MEIWRFGDLEICARGDIIVTYRSFVSDTITFVNTEGNFDNAEINIINAICNFVKAGINIKNAKEKFKNAIRVFIITKENFEKDERRIEKLGDNNSR